MLKQSEFMGIYYHHLINLIVGSPNSNTFCRAMAMHGYESSPRRKFWAEFPGGFVHNPRTPAQPRNCCLINVDCITCIVSQPSRTTVLGTGTLLIRGGI